MEGDEELLRRAESALAELDRRDGLGDEHADVLAALRIRLEGGPRKSLDDMLRAAGSMKGKSLGDVTQPGKLSFEDAAKQATPKKKDWPGL